MKRFHVHLGVDDLQASIGFYSTLFAAPPTVQRPDYAKWMLEDPRVNFAISSGHATRGVEHLGIQVEDEGIDRFYFSHLNYAGRGNKNRKDDAQHQLTRWAMDLLFDTCWEYNQRGLNKEFTTGNNAGLKPLEIKAYAANGTITLFEPAYYTPVIGDAYALIPGCRKREADCRDKYGNIVNFFGFTRIPTTSTYTKVGAA